MEINVIDQGTYLTVQPVGEVDAHSSIVLDEKFTELIEAGKVNLHLDCGNLVYISSAGLGVIISHLDLINEQHGKLVVSRPNENVAEVLELLGLNQLLAIVSDTEEVGAYFQENESIS
jgi:anti-sigma B factor antagonist